MNFTLIKNPDQQLIDEIQSYCLKSKPYEFCNLGSRKLSLFKIKEYIKFLFENCEVYISRSFGELFFAAISLESEKVNLQFVFSSRYKLRKYFPEFRKFLKETKPHIETISTEIQRKHKIEKLISGIRKYDESVKINLDNNKICLLWNT